MDKSFNRSRYLDSKKKSIQKRPQYKYLYLISETSCNFSCKYCVYDGEIKRSSAGGARRMSDEVAKKAVLQFDEVSNADRVQGRYIVYYGGEPLLNFPLIKTMCDFVESERLNFKTTIMTNGSLINEDMIETFDKYRVHLAFSIDGNQIHHDGMRVDNSLNPTFNKVVSNFKRISSLGIPVSVSCTLHANNYRELPYIIDYFHNELNVRNLGFNIVHGKHGKELYVEDVTQCIVKCFHKLIEYKMYEGRLMERVKSFANSSFFLRNCASYGRKYVVDPDGRVGPCHAFAGDSNCFDNNVDQSAQEILNSTTLAAWNYRSVLDVEECLSCPAIGLCGGGCAYNSFRESGTIFAKDSGICKYANTILEWLLQEARENIFKEVIGGDSR